MNFDPAITAREALTRAYVHDDLGDSQPDIEEAEETFSSEMGLEARQAYETLIAIGETLPDALAFQGIFDFHHLATSHGGNHSSPFPQGRSAHRAIS